MRPWLTSQTTGKGKSDLSVNTLVSRLLKLLVWTFKVYSNGEHIPPHKLTKWMRRLIKHQPELIVAYFEDLGKRQQPRAQTVLNTLDDIAVSFEWFKTFSGHLNSKGIGDVPRYKTIIKGLRKTSAKALRKEKSSDDRSIEGLIENGKWPAGGLADCKVAVDMEFELLMNTDELVLGEQKWNFFLQTFFASLWTHTPQGRVLAVTDIKMSQVDEIVTTGKTSSPRLKTNVSFGYQDILFGPVSQRMVLCYVQHFRPLCTPGTMDFPAAPLFLKFDGTPVDAKTAGLYVSNFFKRVMGLRITTNTLRSIVETQTAQLVRAGKF